MGHREYLGKLSLGQLETILDMANALIAEKKKEQLRVVWWVEDRDMRLQAFADTDYMKAAEYLLEAARLNAESPQKLSPIDKALRLWPEYVRESEYAELGLSGNAENEQ